MATAAPLLASSSASPTSVDFQLALLTLASTGVEITAGERRELLERVDLLMQQVADLRHWLAQV